ncbi:MAG: sugar-binding domain-containing protein, partial [bacterium]
MTHFVFRMLRTLSLLAAFAAPIHAQTLAQRETIPLPEHPRPDFQRPDWINLNGHWQFKFDGSNQGERARWFNASLAKPHSILVPFSWGAPLSGVADSADIGWYQRSITVPTSWRGKRVFLVVGASDWKTSVWLGDKKVGEHQGGYTPFSVELTPSLTYGAPQRVTLR